jgi:bacterial/archaeal transporter family-2 protein
LLKFTRVMSRGVAILCTLAVGGLIALQAPANAALAKHVSDLGAAFVSGSITMATVGIVLVVFGHPGRLNGLGAFKPEYVIGGLGGAAVVAISLITVRSLGAGGVTALLVAAQLAVSILADRYEWFGLHHVDVTPGRVAGLALVIVGTVLITR